MKNQDPEAVFTIQPLSKGEIKAYRIKAVRRNDDAGDDDLFFSLTIILLLCKYLEFSFICKQKSFADFVVIYYNFGFDGVLFFF